MVGGTSKIPIVKAKLSELFDSNDIKVMESYADLQLMVVEGSGILGGKLTKGDEKDNYSKIVHDVLPLALGFSVCQRKPSGLQCNIMDKIIQKNQNYPTRAQSVYCQRDPTSTVAKFSLYEGDNDDVRRNYLIGEFEVHGMLYPLFAFFFVCFFFGCL